MVTPPKTKNSTNINLYAYINATLELSRNKNNNSDQSMTCYTSQVKRNSLKCFRLVAKILILSRCRYIIVVRFEAFGRLLLLHSVHVMMTTTKSPF